MILITLRFFFGFAVLVFAGTEAVNTNTVRMFMAVAGLWHVADGLILAAHMLATRK